MAVRWYEIFSSLNFCVDIPWKIRKCLDGKFCISKRSVNFFICIGNSMICSGICTKYQFRIMLLLVYITTRKRFVIFTCRYFKLSWDTTALSQSDCRNFSCSSSINYINTRKMPNHFTLIFFAAKGAIYYVAVTTVIFSFAKITCCFHHVWRFHAFTRKRTWYFSGAYTIKEGL